MLSFTFVGFPHMPLLNHVINQDTKQIEKTGTENFSNWQVTAKNYKSYAFIASLLVKSMIHSGELCFRAE